jgi:hypothetical protein
MFAAGDDGILEFITRGPAPRHLAPVYGQAPYLSANPSTSGGAWLGLNLYVGPYYLSARTSQGCLIRISSSSGTIPDRDFIEDYPEIGGSVRWNSAIKACHINMVGPAKGNSQNISSKYPTIGGSETSNTSTPVAILFRI